MFPLSVCVCDDVKDRLDSSPGWVLALAVQRSGARLRQHLMRNTKPSGRLSNMWSACVRLRSVCVFIWIMNEPSNSTHMCVCLCLFVRGCRMIHLAVLPAAALSSNIIRRSPSPSLSRHELFISQPTAYLIAWIDDTKQINLRSLLPLRWSGCRPFAPPWIAPILHTLSVLLSHGDKTHFILHIKKIILLSLL